MNFWICAGVFSARKVRTFSGDKPKVSCLSRRIPFLDSFLPFKGKAAALLEILGNYTEVSTKAGFCLDRPLPAPTRRDSTPKKSLLCE